MLWHRHSQASDLDTGNDLFASSKVDAVGNIHRGTFAKLTEAVLDLNDSRPQCELAFKEMS